MALTGNQDRHNTQDQQCRTDACGLAGKTGVRAHASNNECCAKNKQQVT